MPRAGRRTPHRTGSKRNASPTKPSANPTYADARKSATEGDPVDERHPDRDAPDEERGDPGRDGLLSPREDAMPGHEQQPAEDERGADLRSADAIPAAVTPRQREREQDGSRDQVPDGHREERRQIADDDRERDERRAPDEVQRSEGKPDSRAVSRNHPPSMAASRPISSSPVQARLDQSV